MKEIDVRLTVTDDTKEELLLTTVGEYIAEVREAVVLKNDGFANLIPDETTRQEFTWKDGPDYILSSNPLEQPRDLGGDLG